MAIRFIGNKQKLLETIVNKICETTNLTDGTFVDLFTGTGVIAKAFKEEGFNIIANDKLISSVVFSQANLLVNSDLKFERVLKQIKEKSNEDKYQEVIDYLNKLEPIEGFFYQNYAPGGSGKHLSEPRKYFTDNNAKKIDAIRNQINLWEKDNLITSEERSVLISSLMLAVNQVANISGTYGAYLKKWYSRAEQEIELNKYPITYGKKAYKVFNKDANELVRELPKTDIIYLDPPYTKRQYHAYYHILETLAIGDNPNVWGKTGQRPKKEEDNSLYCYKKYARETLSDLVLNVNCNHLFLSYSTDGHVEHKEILDILSQRGIPEYWKFEYKRFKSNNLESSQEELKEILYYVRVVN